MRRFATVSTGWNRASSDTPATADPIILASDFPDTCILLVAMTLDEVDLSLFGVIVR